MILVILGTSEWDFSRLIKEIDLISKDLDEEILIQTGYSEYKPKYAKFFKFVKKNEMEDLYKKARIVISHAGAGSIILALKYKKNLIIVPRMEKYKEHFDNHQVELAGILKENGIMIVWDINNLENALNQVKNIKFKSTKDNLVKSLKTYLDDLAI